MRLLRVVASTLPLVLLTACHPQEKNEGARLALASPFATPGQTFEVRFDEPMAAPEAIGTEFDRDYPLVIKPTVRGRFTWTTGRNGVFVPSEPLRMNTRYEIGLRPGLRNAKGEQSRAQLRRFVQTPPFEITAITPRQSTTNADSEPELKLVFNSEVKAEDVQHYFSFRNTSGFAIGATVCQGIGEDRIMYWEVGGNEASLMTWADQFQEKTNSRSRRNRYATDSSTNIVPNLLLVTPNRPLPVGKWELVASASLPSADGKFRLAQTRIPVGDVQPFSCTFLSASHEIGTRAEIRIGFSKALSPALTNSWAQWIELQPAVSNVSVRIQGSAVVISGDYRSGASYAVVVRPGLPAAKTFKLDSLEDLAVTIPPIEPRLYFPEFSGEQMSMGNRVFPMQVVNIPRVRVRAKLIDSWGAAHVLRGYRSYSMGLDAGRIDFNLIAGKTIFNREIQGSTERDEPRVIPLQWNDILDGRTNGIVFIEAEAARENGEQLHLGAQALMQLTDLGVIWKVASGQTEAHVFSYKTGEPVPGATVKLVTDENEFLGSATTDAQGLARIATNGFGWVLVDNTNDLHAVSSGSHNILPWNFSLPSGYELSDTADRFSTLLFGDRTLYRPGETLYLKAIAREWTSQGIRIPAGASNTVEFFDARGTKFFTTNLCFNELGALDLAVQLPGYSRGGYRAELRSEHQTKEYHFSVQDFVPNAFEISLDCKRSLDPGEVLEIPVSARYFMGKALSKAQVKWWVDLEDSGFACSDFPGYNFSRCSLDNPHEPEHGTVSLTGTIALTNNLVIRPELPSKPVSPRPQQGSIRIEITDVNQQTLAREISFVQHSSEFYIGLHQEESVLEAGSSLKISAAIVGTDSKPWPSTVKATVKLNRVGWDAVRIQGTGKRLRYRTQAVFTNVFEREIELSPSRLPATPDDELETCQLSGINPTEPGDYLLQVRAKDAQGRDVVASTQFSVSAHAETVWDYRNGNQITLKAAKPSYHPGETAEILIEAPFQGQAFVTIERETVLRSFVTPVDGTATMIKVPLEAGDAPNVFVSVILVRGSDNSQQAIKTPEFRVGYCELPVEDPAQHLEVCVSSQSTNYLPGQTVEVLTEIKDNRGAPVANAEVTLYAVDEGILSLTETEAPDPYAFFYKSRPLQVSSGISLPKLLPEDPDQLSFQNKGYTGGDGAGNSRLRKNFKACAIWNATLHTGDDGRVAARFAAPDSLTRYRIVAVAQTVRNQFGSAVSKFEVSKPLVVEPALPRFATIGDHIQARAVVLNQTDRAGDVLVTLELDNKATNSTDLSRRVPVTAHGAAAVEFPIELVDTGDAVWIWKTRFADAGANDFTDAVQSTLGVGEAAPTLREIRFARCVNGETNLLATADPLLLAGQGKVTVTIGNTRLNDLGEAVSQLLHYPYGCVEQTSSSLLPWLVLRDTPGLLACVTNRMGGRITGAPYAYNSNGRPNAGIDPDAAICAGITRLLTMQTDSGGLAYWPHQQEPMLWGSAYGGMVLALAKRHGAAVPEAEFKRLMEYLSDQLRTADDKTGRSDCCLALYTLALAGSSEPAYVEKLFQERQKLSSEDRALLALALAESNGSTNMLEELLAPGSIHDSDQAFFCPSREIAVRLLARVIKNADDSTVDALVNDLLRGREWAHWGTTQGNAWAVLALTEYSRRVETTRSQVEAVLRCGSEAITFALSETNAVVSRSFRLATNSPVPAITLANSTSNNLFASITVESRPRVVPSSPQDHGFAITRKYELLDDDNHPGAMGSARVGDRVLITLTLSARNGASYLAIDDPLPAVLEAINPEFKSQGGSAADSSIEDLQCSFKELLTDRASFFVDNLAPGNYTIQYLARVRASGTVVAPSTKVEAMYHPDRFGLSGTQTITTKPLE